MERLSNDAGEILKRNIDKKINSMMEIKGYFEKSMVFMPFLMALSCITIKANAQQGINLSGKWSFRYDPSNYGLSEGWYHLGSLSWDAVSVPSSFNTGHNPWYSGAVWYRRSFNVPDHWKGGSITLRFLGVNIRSQVWVNGEPIGSNNFPYLPFEFNITPFVHKDTTNLVVIRVSNKIQKQAIPDDNWDGWWNYGGITREVLLLHNPDRYINHVSYKTVMGKRPHIWKLTLSLKALNLLKATNAILSCAIKDSSGNVIWKDQMKKTLLNGSNHYVFTAKIGDVHAWSPDSPTLYNAVVTLHTSSSQVYKKKIQFGFRQVETEGSSILLNGKHILLKGIARHEMYPGEGMTLTKSQTRADLEHIKALGANIIRTPHYANHPRLYKMADELGLLIWTEIPAWKTSTSVLVNPDVWENYAKPQLKALVHWYGNHPSVIIWSVGNEFDSDTEKGKAYVKRAIDYVHNLDSTRLVTFASDDYRSQGGDQSFKYVDIIAMNEYFGWYYGEVGDVGPTLDRIHKIWPSKPILVSEVGAGSVLGYKTPDSFNSKKNYSPEHQVTFLKNHLSQIFAKQRRNFVAGGIVWTYNDFPDPHRVGKNHPKQNNYVNSKGLVTQQRREKPAYELVKEIYNKLPAW